MSVAFFNLVPSPLHPAVVHFPIVLAMLVPVFAMGALVMIQRGARPLRAWGLTTALLAALSLSAWASLETGEDQEERVEDVVPERVLETHEESAEAFLSLSLVVLGIAGAGLLKGRIGSAARVTAAVGTLALVFAGFSVGHSGGALVYEYGAGSAYTSTAGNESAAGEGQTERSTRGDDDDDDDDR